MFDKRSFQSFITALFHIHLWNVRANKNNCAHLKLLTSASLSIPILDNLIKKNSNYPSQLLEKKPTAHNWRLLNLDTALSTMLHIIAD